MDYQPHYQQYGHPEPQPHPPQQSQPPYDPYYAAAAGYHQPYDPSAAYYDYAPYVQPPPPGVEGPHFHYGQNEYGQMVSGFGGGGSSQGVGDALQTGAGRGNSGNYRGSRGNFGNRRGGFYRGNFGNSRGRFPNRQLSRGNFGNRSKAPAQHKPAVPKPPKEPKPHAWCDICRVDCNSLEILEQHKAGKKHKKTIQRLEEYEKIKQISGSSQYQSVQVPVSTPAHVQVPVLVSVPETVPVFQPKAKQVEEPAPVSSEANLPITAPEHNVELREEQSKRPREDGFGLGSAYGYGNRYNTGFNNRGGRNPTRGKRPKRFGEFNPVPRPVQEQVQKVRPVVCTLCNVNCDTAAVFEAHLLGKKHLGRVKKFQRPDSVFGPITVYIPPNQPVSVRNVGPEPIFYGLTTVELIQQHEMVMTEEMDGEKEERLEEINVNDSNDLAKGNEEEGLDEGVGFVKEEIEGEEDGKVGEGL